MSTGLNCAFIKNPTTGQWFYLLEQWTAPKGAWDWREYTDAYGPFPTEEAAWEHLKNNHANPGGAEIHNDITPDRWAGQWAQFVVNAQRPLQAESVGAVMTTRTIRLYVEVTVPNHTTDEEVEEALNAALDEPPCDWGTWTVGAIIVEKEAR